MMDITSKKEVGEELVRLKTLRATIDERTAPAKKALEEAANESEKYRVIAMEARNRLDEARGPEYFKLRKKIGILSTIFTKLGG
jgi:hypothetical protein